jgi:hypothetical protein
LPLSEKARIEAYLPDPERIFYPDLLEALEEELTHTFGGCTVIQGLRGTYLSRAGIIVRDQINLIYTDTPLRFEKNLAVVSKYAEELRAAVAAACNEEAILVVAYKVFHSQS